MKIIRFCTMLLVCLLILGTPFVALAKENSNAVAPKLVNLAPITFAAEITEKYASQILHVTLRVSLSDAGAVQEGSQLIESSGNDLIDQVVINAVKASTFQPAYRDGKAIASSILLPLQIQVKNEVPQEEVHSNEGEASAQQK